MHEAHEAHEEVEKVIVWCTDFGEIEYPYMTAEQAERFHRADVTRYWFLLGDRYEAEVQSLKWREK